MTAATVTTRPNGVMAEHNVLLTATNSETYLSPFKTIVGVHAKLNESVATDQPVSVSVSSSTITIHQDDITDKKVWLQIYGYYGK